VAAFADAAEFREVFDRIFTMLSEDPDVGPRLQAADVPQRLEFGDLGLVLNVRPARAGENGHLHWEWGDEVGWAPRVRLAMSSEIANRYFQGRENIAMAIARRRIRAGGDVRATLELVPLTRPVYARYRELVAVEYPHLVVEVDGGPR
jgi:hypothetical protein